MTLNEVERRELALCSAIFTRNRRELEKLLSEKSPAVDERLRTEAVRIRKEAPIPGDHFLVRLSHKLPARLQFVGQRAVLLFPRVARRLLRSSGLHNQMF